MFDHPSYSGSVSEGASTQTVVLEVQASDGDGSAPNNEIKYSIIGGGADLPFAIQVEMLYNTLFTFQCTLIEY